MPKLNIKLLHAKNLPPKVVQGTTYECDPVVVCTVNNLESFKTEPIMLNCNPNWKNQKIKSEFVCHFDKMTDLIVLQVEDYNIFTKNKVIGTCIMPIQILEKSKSKEITFDVGDNEASSGQLTVILKAIDFGLSQPVGNFQSIVVTHGPFLSNNPSTGQHVKIHFNEMQSQ